MDSGISQLPPSMDNKKIGPTITSQDGPIVGDGWGLVRTGHTSPIYKTIKDYGYETSYINVLMLWDINL